MSKIIYQNIDSAKDALREFMQKLEELETNYGTNLENDDSCSDTWWTAKYYDKDGTVKTFYY